MAKTKVHAGICQFSTVITAELEDDGQTVDLNLTTTCPNISKAVDELQKVDSFKELFSKLHETDTYKILSPHIPHVACPIYSGVLKAIEVASDMALPADSTIEVEK